MEKIKNFLLATNFVTLALVAIVVRICVSGAGFGEALALAALCSIKCSEVALKGFNNWLESRKVEPLNENVAKELELIKASMGGLMIKNSVRPSSPEQAQSTMRKFF